MRHRRIAESKGLLLKHCPADSAAKGRGEVVEGGLVAVVYHRTENVVIGGSIAEVCSVESALEENIN